MTSRLRTALSIATVGVTMVALDLVWVGGVAKSVYDKLGPLKRDAPSLPAAGLFYAMYCTATFLHAVRPSPTVGAAAMRGAGIGLVAYATYELTNAAVIRDWPPALVPVDTLWGVVLSAAAASAGRAVLGSGVVERLTRATR
jgi:uncharacterized membrane protein